MTDQDIAKLICMHTGRRISLNIEEYYQHLEFARAVIAATELLRRPLVNNEHASNCIWHGEVIKDACTQCTCNYGLS